jgi:hypothetical protein
MLIYHLRQICHMLIHNDIDEEFKLGSPLREKVFPFKRGPKTSDYCV